MVVKSKNVKKREAGKSTGRASDPAEKARRRGAVTRTTSIAGTGGRTETKVLNREAFENVRGQQQERKALREEVPEPTGSRLGTVKTEELSKGKGLIRGAEAEEIDRRIRAGEFGEPNFASDNPLSSTSIDDELERKVLAKEITLGEAAQQHNAQLQIERPDLFQGVGKLGGEGLLGGDYLTGRNIALAAGAGILIAGGIIAAGTGVLGSAAVFAVRRAFATAAGRAIATRGLSIPSVSRIAAGQLAKGGLKRSLVDRGTWAAAKAMRAFSKTAAAAKRPQNVIGILGVLAYTSIFWGPNEKGDALISLGIAQKTALQNGDFEQVAEIAEDIEEAENVRASMPVIGFVQAELAKFEALRVVSETNMRAAAKQLAGTTPQQIRDKGFEERRNE